MQYEGKETELLCLNWAKDVRETCGGTSKCWHNISGTAWYLRRDGVEDDVNLLKSNHKRGLYYTWLNDQRCHALFFIYEPAVFKIIASKVAHIGVLGSISRRRVPNLQATSLWDPSTLQWVDTPTLDDRFSTISHESGTAKANLEAVAGENPFAAERALALAAGKIPNYRWHSLMCLDSCGISSTEVLNRVTVCHDTDENAIRFRTKRLKNANRLTIALGASLPEALADLKGGYSFDWTPQSPHTNIVSSSNRRATLIYLDDEHTIELVEEIAIKAADYIGQWEKSSDAIVEGKQRLAVWYRNHEGHDVQFGQHRYTEYDQPHTDSPVDFGRQE